VASFGSTPAGTRRRSVGGEQVILLEVPPGAFANACSVPVSG
jgi:hypothetical protein